MATINHVATNPFGFENVAAASIALREGILELHTQLEELSDIARTINALSYAIFRRP